MASLDEFKQLELRVAVIVEAKPHPNADRLYVLDIQVGEERKQVVAGIRLHYSLEELVGKKVVIVNNLEPATIRGVESRGMILAANDGDKLVLITPDRDIASGAQVR
ncbi:MAG: methionine--tRNA ligase subunit beta [Omnitrophica bacterium RIFCSPHIGHO2_02_FULL_46_11]|nr:MAG: methionine--tRNA ligase subunit beta [Omnitrophica bacterium RIFCSPHIGHO2_02_FULL_46_11]OGW86847.1 MAG: methionine--tRNA ligase subunit beta [Omnitrophica bacterium RIFCSPLOWO2_01_FULL_45_10b]